MRGGVEQGAGRGTQKEARDKVTRMDEGSEQKWNRWRREGRSAQESVPGERKRERGLVEGAGAARDSAGRRREDGRGGPRIRRGDLEEGKSDY